MIMGISHTAYGVADLETSLGFYVDGLGFTEVFRFDHEDGTPWLIYLHAGGTTFIELFPEGSVSEAGDTSYKHLCLQVDDLDATLAEMATRGMEPLGPASQGRDGNLQAWFRDPDGNPIEFMQITPDSPQGLFLSTLAPNVQ